MALLICGEGLAQEAPRNDRAVLAAEEIEGISGRWEGEVETPRWPLYVEIEISGENLSRSRLITLGREFPLADPRVRDGGVELTIAGPWDEPPTLWLKRGAKGLSSFWREGDADMPLALIPLTSFPAPSSREVAWQQDIETLRTRFLAFDRTFSADEREAYLGRLATVEANLANSNDAEITLALAQAIALAGNAHTRLYLLRKRSVLDRLPLRLWLFGDELRVVSARSDYAGLLGCRVDAIGGTSSMDAHRIAASAFAGNESWARYKTVYYLTSATALTGLGIAPAEGPVAFALSDCASVGVTPVERLEPVPSDEETEAWRDLSPLATVEPGWSQVLSGRSPMALHLQNPDRHYSFARIESENLFYIQINRAEPMEAETIEDFSARVLAEYRRDPGRALIIDLRFNTGGNGSVLEDLMQELERESRGHSRFVVTGRATFSAGIMLAARWQKAGEVTIVGEPVGDAIDYWAEGGNIILPNSRITAHFANGAHSYSPAGCPENAYCLDLDIPDLDPDWPVETTWSQYLAGQDPALEAILSQLAKRR